jgi:hypothetical protein
MITNASNYTDEQFGTKFQSYVAQLSGLGVVLSDSCVNDVINAQAKSSQANAVNSIIGSYSEANKSQKTTGLSNFNQNLALMGYKTINKDQMVQLAQALGLFDIDNVEDIQDTTAGRINKNRILEELKKYLSGSTFATGGFASLPKMLNEDGIGFVRNGEPILSVEQGKLFKELVANIKPLNNLVKLSVPNVTNLVTNNNSSSPTFQFGSMIQIMGNADSTVIPKIKSVGDDIVKRIMDAARTR